MVYDAPRRREVMQGRSFRKVATRIRTMVSSMVWPFCLLRASSSHRVKHLGFTASDLHQKAVSRVLCHTCSSWIESRLMRAS
ncbi:hypothetical protein M3J07_003611 [Ascochyta lentis]